MARKKLSKVLAWTLVAAMAVSPVNLTWASESADMFSDNSENTESVEMSADETDSLQQNEQDTQAIVSAGEENEDSFTSEDSEEVFSAGEQTSNVSGEKTITGEDTFFVKSEETFVFAPTENATYRISTDQNYNLDIKFSENNGMYTENYYTIKTGPEHSYTIYVVADTDRDIPVKIEKVSAIESISVDSMWPKTVTYPVEKVIDNEIDDNLPVTLQLMNGQQTTGKYNYKVDGYGSVHIVYEDSKGKRTFERPTEAGTYKYYFYCEADPDIISDPYTMVLKSFDDIFKNNNVSESNESYNVTFDNHAYIKSRSYIQPEYSYGFKVKTDKDITYYADFNGSLLIKSLNTEGYGTIETALYESDCFRLQAGKEYYFVLVTDEPMEDGSNTLVIEPTKEVIDKIEWITPPTTTFIEDIEDYVWFTNLGIKVRITYKDGDTKDIAWSEKDEQLGTLKYYESTDENKYHYYFPKNPLNGIDFSINKVPWKDAKNSIPEIKLGEEAKAVERNFNNYNTFKFVASKAGNYEFEFDGTPVNGIGDTESTYIIEDRSGNVKGNAQNYYFNEDDSFPLEEGDTIYIFAGPYEGELKVKVSEKTVISGISLINLENLPVLYDGFLHCLLSDEDMESYLKNAEFKVDFSDGTSKNIKFGNKLGEYGEFHISSFGYGPEEDKKYKIRVCFSEDEECRIYSVVLDNIKNLADSENGIDGLSNDVNSAKSYEFSEDDRKYFYIENTLDKLQGFELKFTGHTENDDDDDLLLAATFDGKEWSYQKLWLDSYPDKNYAKVSVALNAGSKMYLEYFGNADSVELVTDDIIVNEIKLLPGSRQIFNNAQLTSTLGKLGNLNFLVDYTVNGNTYGTVLTPGEIVRVHNLNLSIEVLFDNDVVSVENLDVGSHTVKCRIPKISDEYREVGNLEVLSYKTLFASLSDVDKTVSFDKTKTFRDMNCVGFNIPKAGYYKITFLPDDSYEEDDYRFVATDIKGEYTVKDYGMMSLYGGHHYFDQGLLMVFAKGASNVTVSATNLNDLRTLYEECLKFNKSDYEELSWEHFSVALNDAKDFIDHCNEDYDERKLAETLNYLISARDDLIAKHDIDFSKNPQFIWEIVPGKNLGTMENYGAIPKYNAKAVFYCNCCEDYTVEKTCSVSYTTVMGTNGSSSLVYTASVTVEGHQYSEEKVIRINQGHEIKNEEVSSTILPITKTEAGEPQIYISGIDEELVKGILTEIEKGYYNDKKVNTKVKLIWNQQNINNSVSEEEKEQIEQELEVIKQSIFGKQDNIKSEIDFKEISLTKLFIKGDIPMGDGEPVKELIKPITIDLDLSDKEQQVGAGYVRSFYVIHIHDGKIERLDAERIGNKLRFKTDKFSTYAVAYIDVKASTSSPSYPDTPSYPVTDVTLSQDKADLTKVGEILQLTATVKPSYADNKTITWKSSDEKVATVDKDGKVTAVANGTATITATSADGKHSATAVITVKIAPEKLTLTAENKTLTKVGDTLQITAKIEPDNAYDKLIWKSGDERVAIVDADGKVTATGNGKAIITATTEDSKLSESVTITVKIPEKPAVNAITGYGNLKARSVTQTNNSIKVEWSRLSGADGYIVYGSQCNGNGKAYKYKKLATITNGKTRTWTHTKLKKATYYKYIVKAYKLVDGKKVITDTSVSVHAVTKGGNYGVAKAVSVTKIGNKKNVTEVILKKGKTAQITAAEVKKDKKIKHHRKLCYESSNPNVATVTAKGMIKAIGKGSCTVWVYAQNGVYKAITVTVK